MVVVAAIIRSRTYAIFRGVILTIYTLIAIGLRDYFDSAGPVFLYLHATVYLQSLILARPRLMPLAYRIFISIPGLFFAAGTIFAMPWAVVAAFGIDPVGAWIPYAIALLGVAQSLSARSEEVDLVVADGEAVDGLRRHPFGDGRTERPLEIVQLTDPHLGPFMSVARLRSIAQRAADRDPDLVVLTGDFLTMESQKDPSALRDSLEPLKKLEGRVVACFGNHDHEAPDTVRSALEAIGATLLIDDAAVFRTPAGPVQIVGMDFAWRERRARLHAVCERHPRIAGMPRIVLLHDPGAFKHLPPGEGDLVLSGHTHGGQVGLVSLGLSWTMLQVFVKGVPDHGFWADGTNRLYVHRGTGHYGFPLRVGVPAEESLLRVHFAS